MGNKNTISCFMSGFKIDELYKFKLQWGIE
jgi:hypothetical protein